MALAAAFAIRPTRPPLSAAFQLPEAADVVRERLEDQRSVVAIALEPGLVLRDRGLGLLDVIRKRFGQVARVRIARIRLVTARISLQLRKARAQIRDGLLGV